jgi:glycosyltransferase involved in cell wall biosynthesis
MKKIILLINTFSVGGVENHLLSIVKNIDKTKYNIHVGYFRLEDHSAKSMLEDFSAIKGITLVNFNIHNFFCIRHIYKLYKYFKNEQFDIVHTFLFRADLLGILFGRLTNINKIIASIHDHSLFGYGRNKFIFYFAEKIMNYIYALADNIIVISNSIKETFIVKYPLVSVEKINVIYYGINIYSSKHKKIPDDFFTICTIGRIDRNKNQILILKSLNILINKFNIKNIRIIIAGHDDYNYFNIISDYIKINKLTEFVDIHGFVRNPKIIMNQSDIFISSSIKEGLGLIVLEAMNFRIPCLVSNSGAFPELIVDGYSGFVFENNDENALVEKILSIMKISDFNYYTSNARNDLISKFNINDMIKAIEGVYQ